MLKKTLLRADTWGRSAASNLDTNRSDVLGITRQATERSSSFRATVTFYILTAGNETLGRCWWRQIFGGLHRIVCPDGNGYRCAVGGQLVRPSRHVVSGRSFGRSLDQLSGLRVLLLQQSVHRLLLVLLAFHQLKLLPLLRLDGALLKLKLLGNGLLLAAEAERNVPTLVLKNF